MKQIHQNISIKHLYTQYLMNLIKFDILRYQKEIHKSIKEHTGNIESIDSGITQMMRHVQQNNSISIEALQDCLCLLLLNQEVSETKEILLDKVIVNVIEELNTQNQCDVAENKISFIPSEYNVFVKTQEYLLETIVKKMYDLAKTAFDENIMAFSTSLNSSFASITLKYEGYNSKMIDLINEPIKIENNMQNPISQFNNPFSFLKLLEHLNAGVLSFAHENSYSLINFTLHLPVRSQKTNQGDKSQLGDNKYNWKDKTVLIVDDIEVNYMFLQTILAETNVKTLYAANGELAVSECKSRNDIHAVLMDLKMPVMDGYVATSIIKDMNPALPVIIQTAYSFSEEFEKCVKIGCNDFITKPLKSENVLGVLAKYLN